MKIRSRGLIALLSVLVALTVAYLASEFGDYAARWAKTVEKNSNVQNIAVRIIEIDGKVKRKTFGQMEFESLPKGKSEIEVFNLDSIQVEARSSAKITIGTGYEINLTAQTLVVPELWNPNEPDSPVYLHILKGEIEVIKKGKRGSVFILRDGSLSYPEGMKIKQGRELVIRPQDQLESTASLTTPTPEIPTSEPAAESEEVSLSTKTEETIETPATEQEGSTAQTVEAAAPENKPTTTSPTLSDEYLDEVIASQRANFQKCQANTLRDNVQAKGQITVGFKVLPAGNVSELHILNSDITDDTFQKCILSVFERVSFKSFEGDPIARSYPLSFE